MTAFLAVHVTITDEARWATYRDAVGPLIAAFGGKRASGGARANLLEGPDDGRRIVLFDPSTIGERATYESPHQLSTGVQWVLVNGKAVLANGKPTGTMAGRVLRGPGYRQAAP